MREPTIPGPVVARAKRSATTTLPRFRSGDLVTADTLNALVDAINALAARVAVLEKRCG